MCVNGQLARLKVYSGTNATVVPLSFPGIPRKLNAAGELAGPGNQLLIGLCNFQATLELKGKCTVEELYVMRALTTSLIWAARDRSS